MAHRAKQHTDDEMGSAALIKVHTAPFQQVAGSGVRVYVSALHTATHVHLLHHLAWQDLYTREGNVNCIETRINMMKVAGRVKSKFNKNIVETNVLVSLMMDAMGQWSLCLLAASTRSEQQAECTEKG